MSRRDFHATRPREVWPFVIVGGGLAYLFARWIINYRDERARMVAEGLDPDADHDDAVADTEGLPSSLTLEDISNMQAVVGLDLGSSFSRIAIVDNAKGVESAHAAAEEEPEEGVANRFGRCRVVENEEGSRSTPSVVGVQGDDDFVVGQMALNLDHFWSPHSLLGRRSNDPVVETFVDHFGCEENIVSGIGGTMQIVVGSARSSAELLTAKLAEQLRNVADQHLDAPCTHALVTVPDELVGHEPTMRAIETSLAQMGVKSLGLHAQSVCAAVGAQEMIGQTGSGGGGPDTEFVVVCDVGRSTQAALLQLGSNAESGSGTWDLLHSEVAPFVGGAALDNAIVDDLLGNFEKEHNMDLRSDPMSFNRVVEAANVARHELSTKLSAEINLPYISADATGPKHMMATLSRSKYEQLTSATVERILDPVNRVLEREELKSAAEGQVSLLIVGGCARSELLREAIVRSVASQLPGEAAAEVVLEMPEEAIVLGAARLAADVLGRVQRN